MKNVSLEVKPSPKPNSKPIGGTFQRCGTIDVTVVLYSRSHMHNAICDQYEGHLVIIDMVVGIIALYGPMSSLLSCISLLTAVASALNYVRLRSD